MSKFRYSKYIWMPGRAIFHMAEVVTRDCEYLCHRHHVGEAARIRQDHDPSPLFSTYQDKYDR